MPHLYEDTIKCMFIDVFNELISDRDEIISYYEHVAAKITDCSKLENESVNVAQKSDELRTVIENFVAENAHASFDQQEYKRQYDEYVAKYKKLRTDYLDINNQITRKKAKYIQIMAFIKILEQQGCLLKEFD